MKTRITRRELTLLLTLSPLLAVVACGGGVPDTTGAPAKTTLLATTTVSSTPAPVLDQTGNPVYGLLNNYTAWLSKSSDPAVKLAADKTMADNIVSWQMPHGGFYKQSAWYAAPWNGTAARSEWFGANNVELGTIDNQATVTEILFLANVYARTGDFKYRDSARKAIDFLLNMQYSTGGFPQVYPKRGTTYSNYVTFNDDAMIRVLMLFDQALKLKAPLDGDLVTSTQRSRMAFETKMAVQYILKAQIVQNGVRTVWCAQHDPASYAPLGARSYELPSKSGLESARVVEFLMTQPQTAEVAAAAMAAVAWYRSSATQVLDMTYDSVTTKATNASPFIPKVGAATLWYRFYDLATDTGFFSGRLPTDNPPGTGKQYDIMKVEPERRYGYQWAGQYGAPVIKYASQVGY
jgi:PelA/Pel-15E family pectate lyase